MKKEQIVKEIDHQFDRWYDLSAKKDLTEEEVRELKGRSVKIQLFMIGAKLSGMERKEYLSLTTREWGDQAQETGISLCKDGCNCMTKTIDGKSCSKCGAMK